MTTTNNTNHHPACETCFFYRQHTPKTIQPESGLVFHGVGECHKTSPLHHGWPRVYGSDFCGEHSGLLEWLAAGGLAKSAGN